MMQVQKSGSRSYQPKMLIDRKLINHFEDVNYLLDINQVNKLDIFYVEEQRFPGLRHFHVNFFSFSFIFEKSKLTIIRFWTLVL